MMYKYLKIFSIFLFVCFIQTAQSDKCHELFKPLNTDEIQSIFSDPANYARYKDQEGYLLFVQKTPNSDSMTYVFKMVSKALGEDFKELGWKKFSGSIEEFKGLRGKIVNKKGEPRVEYLGPEGYSLFADKYYKGSMLMTFKNTSSVLSKSEFEKLGWQAFIGSSVEFRDLRGKIFDKRDKPKKRYLGQKGYALFADKHYAGDMQKAFKNVSAVLDNLKFRKLNWRQFHGSVEEFRNLRGKILNEQGKLKKKYQDLKGYVLFAKDHYRGDMQKAFKNVSAVLGGVVNMRSLGLDWKIFIGKVFEYQKLVQLFKEGDIY